MTSAGYSGTPLPRKLGLKAGVAGAVLGAPPGYLRSLGAAGKGLKTRLTKPADFVQIFVNRRAELEKKLPAIIAALVPSGMLWVSWPKKSSGVQTDVTEDVIRAVILPKGLVDVKVCAVDETWSGLKVVRRLEHR